MYRNFFDLVYIENGVEIADNADFSQTFTIEAIFAITIIYSVCGGFNVINIIFTIDHINQ